MPLILSHNSSTYDFLHKFQVIIKNVWVTRSQSVVEQVISPMRYCLYFFFRRTVYIVSHVQGTTSQLSIRQTWHVQSQLMWGELLSFPWQYDRIAESNCNTNGLNLMLLRHFTVSISRFSTSACSVKVSCRCNDYEFLKMRSLMLSNYVI